MKPLSEYTVAEIQNICRESEDCPVCPLHSLENENNCRFTGDTLPGYWVVLPPTQSGGDIIWHKYPEDLPNTLPDRACLVQTKQGGIAIMSSHVLHNTVVPEVVAWSERPKLYEE